MGVIVRSRDPYVYRHRTLAQCTTKHPVSDLDYGQVNYHRGIQMMNHLGRCWKQPWKGDLHMTRRYFTMAAIRRPNWEGGDDIDKIR